MNKQEKPLIWLKGEVKTPPFSKEARIEAGCLFRDLQEGIKLSLPHSRPMPSIGIRCHELRITDKNEIWRVIYRIDSDAIIIADVFKKKTRETPKRVMVESKKRLKKYDEICRG
jgi:phage-related protein